MPTVNVPDLNAKETWRTARLLLWSLIATVALLDFINMIQIPEYFAGFTLVTYIVSFWVVAYHALEAMKGKKQ